MSDKDIEYRNYSLGDLRVIELLLLYRYKYDDYLFMRNESSVMPVTGAAPLNEEMLITYATLDTYIKRCQFSSIQLSLIKLIEQGYTYEEIALDLEILPTTITGRLNTIYKRIIKENDWQWKRSVYINKLDLKTKCCSKCREHLPGTPEFYSDYLRSKDGLHSVCRRCR